MTSAFHSCRAYLLLAAVAVAAAPGLATASPIILGAADPLAFALLSVGGNTVTVNNESVIRDFDADGNDLGPDSRQIGIQGVGGKLQMSGGSRIGGPALLADGTRLGITDDNTLQGGIFGTNISGDAQGNLIFEISQDTLLNQAAADAAFFSAFYRGLATTNPGITAVTESQTVLGVAGQNVLSLDKLELGGGEVLTLDGQGSDASFIVNVFGDLKLNSGRIELAGGLTFEEVLFNVVGGKVAFSGGGNSSVLSGVILALDREVALSPGLVKGTIIGTKISLVSGADLDTPAPDIPEPTTLALFAFGLAGLGLMARRRRT